jgi:hypothetical protein
MSRKSTITDLFGHYIDGIALNIAIGHVSYIQCERGDSLISTYNPREVGGRRWWWSQLGRHEHDMGQTVTCIDTNETPMRGRWSTRRSGG